MKEYIWNACDVCMNTEWEIAWLKDGVERTKNAFVKVHAASLNGKWAAAIDWETYKNYAGSFSPITKNTFERETFDSKWEAMIRKVNKFIDYKILRGDKDEIFEVACKLLKKIKNKQFAEMLKERRIKEGEKPEMADLSGNWVQAEIQF